MKMNLNKRNHKKDKRKKRRIPMNNNHNNRRVKERIIRIKTVPRQKKHFLLKKLQKLLKFKKDLN